MDFHLLRVTLCFIPEKIQCCRELPSHGRPVGKVILSCESGLQVQGLHSGLPRNGFTSRSDWLWETLSSLTGFHRAQGRKSVIEVFIKRARKYKVGETKGHRKSTEENTSSCRDQKGDLEKEPCPPRDDGGSPFQAQNSGFRGVRK